MYDPRPDDRFLLQRAQQFDSAQECGASQKQQIELLEGVMDSARTHFILEERLMKRLCYPGIQEHVRAHDSIRQKIVELLQAARGSDKPMSRVIPALATIISAHVIASDAPLCAFLAQAGLLIG